MFNVFIFTDKNQQQGVLLLYYYYLTTFPLPVATSWFIYKGLQWGTQMGTSMHYELCYIHVDWESRQSIFGARRYTLSMCQKKREEARKKRWSDDSIENPDGTPKAKGTSKGEFCKARKAEQAKQKAEKP